MNQDARDFALLVIGRESPRLGAAADAFGESELTYFFSNRDKSGANDDIGAFSY
jgi:hypothetical protein